MQNFSSTIFFLFPDEGRSVDERCWGPGGHAVRILVRGTRFRGLRKLPSVVAQRTLPLARGWQRVVRCQRHKRCHNNRFQSIYVAAASCLTSHYVYLLCLSFCAT